MRRVALTLLGIVGLAITGVAAHWALIEVGREVIVLRTERADGTWLETRLWVVDHDGAAWVHGADSEWMGNLRARPVVEMERAGERRRYRARAMPGPHPGIHEALRAKYGVADAWVRTLGPDDDATMPVRLDPVETPGS